jgi:cobalt-zinc-cadmium resistance protein CzcA
MAGMRTLTQGDKVGDIENVVLGQFNGVPVLVKDVADVKVGFVPRLGICGRDGDDDVVASIVVMSRVEETAKMLPKVKKVLDNINVDGSLPPGVKVVPFYDRGSLIHITTHTVLHNLIFGCLLVFLIQWIFLGDLRSAIIVGINIPFALFFAIMLLVSQGESANLLSVGAVDFGIIVDSAVILVENIFRNFQRPEEERHNLLMRLRDGMYGADPTTLPYHTPPEIHGWTDRLRMILISALQVDKAVFFAAVITVAGFVPLFTMQGVEGQIFGPMARTYGYALAGALIATFTIMPVLGVFPDAQAHRGNRDVFGARLASCLHAHTAIRPGQSRDYGGRGFGLSGHCSLRLHAPGQRIPSGVGRGQFFGFALPCP